MLLSWPRTGVVCLRLACSVWVLDFIKKIFHNKSSGAFKSIHIKVKDSGTKEGLRPWESTGESICVALLWFPTKFIEKKGAKAGLPRLHGEARHRIRY